METKKTSKTFSPEVRARAVRMVQERQGEHASQWAAISSIASKIGCTGETLRNWVRQAERDQGLRTGLTTDAALKRVHYYNYCSATASHGAANARKEAEEICCRDG